MIATPSSPIIRLGLPKGSLETSTISLFAKAGFNIAKSTRSYKPSIDDPELEGRFIRAQEISRYVEHGFFDCGLTGHDWVLENRSEIVEVCDLVYSRASNIPSAPWLFSTGIISRTRFSSTILSKATQAGSLKLEMVGLCKEGRSSSNTSSFSFGALSFKPTLE